MKGDSIRKFAIKALIFAKKASPYVLATLSAAGTIALAVDDIKKTQPKIDIPENADIKEKIAVNVRTYWKPVLYGVGSVACLAGSVFIFRKRQKELSIGLKQMEYLLQRYTQAATATAGVGGVAALNRLEPTSGPENLPEDVDSDGKTQFWDPIFNYWFRVSELDFTKAAYQTCVDFTRDQYVLLSKFYEYMDVRPPRDEDGDGYLGWGWFIDDDWRWFDMYGEEAAFIGIKYSPLKRMDDGLEYREVEYWQCPMFNQNGRMLDINGEDYFDVKL